jgi:hypothetical protein
MERRNPYLILGIQFGASRDEANKAFARRSRPLRQLGDDGRAALTDLTWALHQIDEGSRHPQEALTPYRLPADPHAARVTGDGVFAPPPEVLPTDEHAADAALDALRTAAAHEYLGWLVLVRARQLDPPAA